MSSWAVVAVHGHDSKKSVTTLTNIGECRNVAQESARMGYMTTIVQVTLKVKPCAYFMIPRVTAIIVFIVHIHNK